MESPTDDTIPRPRIPTWLVSHMTWFWLALAVGGLLRLYEWNSLPPPIWGDEAGSAYEAYSLLKTGMDKWGNSWPAYFPAWGSGQSTLHAILSLPLIALFGLNAWTARIVNLVLALLTLPLLYHAVRLALNRAVALLSLWLLALAPWHLMLSRWSLDCNLLPFFILLGVFLLEKVRARPRCRWTYLVFIPWALGLYSYSLFVFYLPFLVLTSLWLYRDALFRRKLPLAVNLSASALVVSPFGLFILKNYVLKASLPFETWLPFDLPMLVSSRLQQINITYGTMLRSNLRFLTRHLQDDLPWNQAPGFPPLFAPILYLAAIGFFIALLVMIREKTPNVFFLWLACCAPAIFIYAYNINRANAIFIPIIVLAAYACVRIWESVGSTTVRYVGAGVLAVSLLIFTGSFVHFYFTDYRSIANRNFTAGLGEALTNAERTGGERTAILVSDDFPLPYNHVLFDLSYPPEEFQSSVRFEVAEGAYRVRSFGRFYFEYEAVVRDGVTRFLYVYPTWERKICPEPRLVFSNDIWRVSWCTRTERRS